MGPVVWQPQAAAAFAFPAPAFTFGRMSQHAILTAIGQDRPGLVDEVSAFIFERGGNIEDSRMVNLRGQFAMMVLISGSEQTLADVRERLGELAGRTGLQADLRPAQPTRPAAAGPALPYRLTASAMDQAGLVHRVSHLLREMNANIESMETNLRPAPVTGSPLFEMELVLSVPRQTSVGELRRRLETLCDEINIDWHLSAM